MAGPVNKSHHRNMAVNVFKTPDCCYVRIGTLLSGNISLKRSFDLEENRA
jgi:hypothetical protein